MGCRRPKTEDPPEAGVDPRTQRAYLQVTNVTTPSVHTLLHPSELSRLALAAAGVAIFAILALLVLVKATSAGTLGAFVLLLFFIAGSIWLGLQVARANQLGRSLRVSHETLPELQAIFDDVRATLGYDRPVEVYVGDKASAPVTTINYLGTRIMILDGGLVGGLLADDKAAELTFLIGREIGALKARLTRLDIFVVILNAVDALKFVAPLLRPYYRATTYSGDQIGMVAAGDLHAALDGTRRLLVGEKLAPSLGVGIVFPQALLVRRRLLPRFGQLFLAEPHITNRYANLLCFSRYYDPDAWERVAEQMSAAEISAFEELWRRSPYARRVPVASVPPRTARDLVIAPGAAGEAVSSAVPSPAEPSPAAAASPPTLAGHEARPSLESLPAPLPLDQLPPPVPLDQLPPPGSPRGEGGRP
jgi:hypothetical protein